MIISIMISLPKKCTNKTYGIRIRVIDKRGNMRKLLKSVDHIGTANHNVKVYIYIQNPPSKTLPLLRIKQTLSSYLDNAEELLGVTEGVRIPNQ